jgi:hypothetical protein
VPCPLQQQQDPKYYKAWLTKVLDDRDINGAQEFLIDWWGSCPHQWVSGKELKCNTALEEYATRTGRQLDWTLLVGGPGGTARKPAPTKRKSLVAIKPIPPKRQRTPGTRSSRPRTCKFT